MLDLAAEKGVKPWITKRPLEDVNKAVPDMEAGKARYRYVQSLLSLRFRGLSRRFLRSP